MVLSCRLKGKFLDFNIDELSRTYTKDPRKHNDKEATQRVVEISGNILYGAYTVKRRDTIFSYDRYYRSHIGYFTYLHYMLCGFLAIEFVWILRECIIEFLEGGNQFKSLEGRNGKEKGNRGVNLILKLLY
ncbi:hypothetical protein Tco_1219757 [Tanacetum coccineum]